MPPLPQSVGTLLTECFCKHPRAWVEASIARPAVHCILPPGSPANVQNVKFCHPERLEKI